jgi:uncharacterized BrkB/YihY/UPF0761 family membrane protein
MKNLLNLTLYTLSVLLLVFVIGMFLPMLFTSILVMFSDITYEDVLTRLDNSTIMFWFICIIGWCCAMFYVNDELNKDKKNV